MPRELDLLDELKNRLMHDLYSTTPKHKLDVAFILKDIKKLRLKLIDLLIF